MKLWQLRSLFDDEKPALLAVLQEPQWAVYFEWYKGNTKHLNPDVLTADLPEELCRRAVALSKKKYCVHDGLLRLYCSAQGMPTGALLMPALEAFERFGGIALAEVRECGSFYLSPPRERMKFWQLVSLFRDEEPVLESVLKDPQWALYFQWYSDYEQHAKSRNTSLLNAEMPDVLCRDAARLSKKNYYVHQEHLYRYDVHRDHLYPPALRMPTGASLMSALEAFEKFGGTALEEVLEFGSFYLRPERPQ